MLKNIYQAPVLKTVCPQQSASLLQQVSSLTGDTGNGTIGNGGDDSGGEYDPDAKRRGGLDGYGNLW